MKKNKTPRTKFLGRNKIAVVLFGIIAVVLVLLLIAGFIYGERRQQLEATKSRLSDAANRDAAIVYNLFEGYINTLRAIAIYLNSFDDLTSAEAIGLLGKMSEAFEFERLSIDFSDGKSYTTDGLVLNITQDDLLESVKSGQIFITDLTNSIIDGTAIVCIHVPIHRDGLPVASLGLSLNRERLNSLLNPLISEEGKYSYIIDEYGEYVAFDGVSGFLPENNFFDMLDIHIFREGLSKELVIEAFANTTAGYTEHSLEGFEAFERYAYYSPVGINKWMIMSIMSKNDIDADTNGFLRRAFILAAQILFIFLVLASFAYREQQKARKIAQLDEKCFRILAEHTGKVVLEWDYSKKIMFYPNFEKAIGRKPLIDSLRTADEAINAGVVHPDDLDIYRRTVSDVMDGRNVENLRLRMRAAGEDYKYYSLSSVVVFDSKRKPYKSIGFLENIDELVRKEKYLLQKADTDQLTGFYNKAATETFISEALLSSSSETTHALFCLDLDNFKGINDGFGHLFGDEVLKELTGNIKKAFRTSDILGRFGGDEFVVFVYDIPSIEYIKEKAAVLNKCLNKTYRKDNVACTVSASIGIAVFPNDGTTYETLYKKADEASYTAKKSGKNTYRFASTEQDNAV